MMIYIVDTGKYVPLLSLALEDFSPKGSWLLPIIKVMFTIIGSF